jgi:RNA polymerase sigma factor (sigma-70 family)
MNTGDGLSYLEQIGRTPLLSAEQEVSLAKSIEAGLAAEHKLRQAEDSGQTLDFGLRRDLQAVAIEGRRAKDNLLEANLRLVVWFANRYRSQHIDFFDLVQEGNLGLIEAVERFDHALGFRFTTYATRRIHSRIARAIAQSKKDAESAIGQRIVSLDSAVGDDGDTNVGDIIVDVEAADYIFDAAVRSRLQDDVANALAALTPRMRVVIARYFGLDGMRQLGRGEIASKEGVSYARVNQLITAGLEKLSKQQQLRNYLAD